MIDRKCLFRGFYPDIKGNTIITLSGEKVTGRWVYGDLQQNRDSIKIREQEYYIDRIAKSFVVIPETVGQFVTTDKNGKDIFEGDIVKILYTDWRSKLESDPRTLEQYLNDIAQIGEVVYEPYYFGVKIGECVCSLHCGRYGFIQLIGNKFEGKMI